MYVDMLYIALCNCKVQKLMEGWEGNNAQAEISGIP